MGSVFIGFITPAGAIWSRYQGLSQSGHYHISAGGHKEAPKG